MRSTLSLLAGFFSLAFLLPALAKTNAPADVAAIKAAEWKFASTSNIDRLVSFYTPQAVVIDAFTPGFYVGKAAIRADYAPQVAPLNAMRPNAIDLNIVTDGKMACAFSQQNISVVLKSGVVFKTVYRIQDIWRKVNGSWLIVQQHVSYPIDYRTGAGVMDGAFTNQGPISWSFEAFPGPSVSEGEAATGIRLWQDRLDAAQTATQAMKSYGPGNYMSMFDSGYPGIYRGLAQVEQGLTPQMQFASIRDSLVHFGVQTDGLFGAAFSVQDVTIHEKDGSTRKATFRQTDCLHMIGGKWYSFQEVVSFPLDLATSKAVFVAP